MNYRDYFISYASEIDSFLKSFIQDKTLDAEKTNPLASDLWRKLEHLIKGGKRIRGGMVRLGYECFEKENKAKILPASAAVEITQGAILIHDDVIDQSPLRHGAPTVHKLYEAAHKQTYTKGDSLHYGESMAIVVGIIGYYGAISLLQETEFSDKLKNDATKELARFMAETGYGEALDVDMAYQSEIKEDDVLTVHRLKTAQYTFVGPLTLGGILAGASQEQLKKFQDFGVPLGIAFQLRDDMLGMFGDPEKTGKPVDDDIKEGKNTLLYTQALKNSTEGQRARLKILWGKKDITTEEFKEAQEIVKTTGSLSYSEELTNRLVSEAKQIIPELTANPSLQEVFTSLSDYIIERQK